MSKFVPNSHQTPNVLVDEIMHLLTESELKCYLFAIRHIYGWQDKIERGYAHISLSMFENGFSTFNGTGLSRSAVNKALKSLVEYRLLLKLDMSTRDGQAYAIGENPDIKALEARKDDTKSNGSNSALVLNSNQQQYEITTATSSKFVPKQTQGKTQEQTAPKNGDARPRKRDANFDWLAVNIFNQDAERIAKRAGGRIAKAKKSLQEIHALHGTELTPAHLDKFVSWWKREYAGLAMPMADDKLAQYYGEFYASQKNKATQSVQTHERTLVMRAQMALGYERIDPSYVDATIKEKMEELRDGYYDVI